MMMLMIADEEDDQRNELDSNTLKNDTQKHIFLHAYVAVIFGILQEPQSNHPATHHNKKKPLLF